LLSLATNPTRTLFYLFLLSIPSQLGRHFWPSFSSINGLRVDYLSPTLYVSDILIMLLFIEMLPILLRTVPLWKPGIVSSVLLLFGYLSFTSLSPLNSLVGVIRLTEVVFISFVCARFLSKPSLTSSIRIIISFSILVMSTLAIWQFVDQSSVGGLWYYLGERSFTTLTPGIANASLQGTLLLRPYATFPHPNVLAGFLIVTSTYLLYFLPPEKEGWFRRGVSVATLFLGIVVTILTMSRTGMVVLAFVYGMWLIKQAFSQKVLFGVVIASLVGIIGFLFQTGIYLRFTTLSFSDEAVTLREFLLTKAWQLFNSHMLTGVGVQNFLPALSLVLPHTTPLTYFQPVHSVYFLVLSETGLLGSGIMLVCLAYLVWKIFSSRQKVGKLVLLFSLLALSLTDHYFYTLHQGQLILAFSLGLIIAPMPYLFTRQEAKILRKDTEESKASKRLSHRPVKISRKGKSSVERK
jgi:O-antigen ligase